MDYPESREYLDGLFRFGSVLGTERMARLMEGLGDPQDCLRFIHVAGTNGKGSVTAMCSSVLEAAGYRTGRYISPYLEEFTERVSVNSQYIPQERVADLLTRIRPVAERMAREGEQPTEFEVVTAMGFLHFLEESCDIVCLEVGLGGRCDATNVIKTPEVSVITSIGMDHMDRLGGTLKEIAAEKAGIIRQGATVISAPQKPDARRVVEDKCKDMEARLCLVGRDITWKERFSGLEGQVIDFEGLMGSYPDVSLSLIGNYQQENAAVALGAIECLHASGMEVPRHAIYEGFQVVSWPGRLEVMGTRPLVVLDSAHNADGAVRLADAVRSVLPHRRLVLVLGILEDKDVTDMIVTLGSLASRAIATRPSSHRALDPLDLAERMRQVIPEVVAEPDIARAVDLGLGMVDPDDLLLVAGSIYLSGPARTHLKCKCLELSGTKGIYL